MLKRWFRYLPAGLILAALTMALVWIARPHGFLDIMPMEQATSFYVWTTSGQGQFYDAHPDREELEPLLELLEPAKLRLESRNSRIKWDRDEWYFGFSCSRPEGGGWVEVAGFDLGTDGMVYTYHDRLGTLDYQLTDCDMDAIEAELLRLLGIS